MAYEGVENSVTEIFNQVIGKYDPDNLELLDEERSALSNEFMRNLETYREQPSQALSKRALKRCLGGMLDYFVLSAVRMKLKGDDAGSDLLLCAAYELENIEPLYELLFEAPARGALERLFGGALNYMAFSAMDAHLESVTSELRKAENPKQ